MTSTAVKHVRKNDLVQVMSGRDRGKTGKVLRVNNKRGAVLIEKLNMVKRHTKASPKGPGGIIESERQMPATKVLIFCEKCGHGVRTRTKVLSAGKKARECAKCSAQLDK